MSIGIKYLSQSSSESVGDNGADLLPWVQGQGPCFGNSWQVTQFSEKRAAFRLRRSVGYLRSVGQTGSMDISINARTSVRRPAFSFTDFFLDHKGDLTLAFSFFVYVVSWIVLMYTRYKTGAEIAVSMAEAALIGGLCDYIALKMIFERRWYLPNSGVLPRNREKLIGGIAATIENEWLTPQMIGRKLNEMDLVGRLGTFLEETKLDDLLGQAGLERILNRAIEYLESPEDRDRLEAILKKALPKTFTRIYAVVNRFGSRTITSRIAATLRMRLPELRNDPELLRTLETAIHEFGEQLHDRESYARKLAQQLIDAMVSRLVEASRGQIAHMVRENLAQLNDEQIRIQIESKTRTHLDWIRVNGGIFGAFFGLIFALARILSHNGPAIAAHFHLGM